MLASESFTTVAAPQRRRAEPKEEPDWELFVSKSSGRKYYVNTRTVRQFCSFILFAVCERVAKHLFCLPA